MITTIEHFEFGTKYEAQLAIPSFTDGSFAHLVAFNIAGVGTYKFWDCSNLILIQHSSGVRVVTWGEDYNNDVYNIIDITSTQTSTSKDVLLGYLKNCEYFEVHYNYAPNGAVISSDIYRFLTKKDESEDDPFDDGESVEPEHQKPKLRWRVPFTSLNGTECRVEIYDEGWVGGVTDLVGGEKPFTYDESSGTGWLDFVRYKTGYINIVRKDFYFRKNTLFSTGLMDRYVRVYYGDDLVFTGYIIPSEYDNPYEEVPYELSIPVISPLGLLDKLSIDAPQSDTVLLGDILKNAVDKLRADYVDVINFEQKASNNFWTIKAASSLFAPYNDNFKHYDEKDKIYEKRKLSFFFEGICKWRAWTLHDTPHTIVFKRNDGGQNYIGYYINECTEGVGHSVLEPFYNYSDYFQNSSSSNTQSVVPTLSSLTLTDGETAKEGLSVKHSQFTGWLYGPDTRWAGLRYIDNDIEGVGDLRSDKMNLEGTFPIGVFIGNYIDNYGEKLSPERWAFCGTKPPDNIILTKHFKSFRYTPDFFYIKIKAFLTNNLTKSENADKINLKLLIRQGNFCCTLRSTGQYYYWSWHEGSGYSVPIQCGKNGSGDTEVSMTAASSNLDITLNKIPTLYEFQHTSGDDLPFEPISVSVICPGAIENFLIIDTLEIGEWTSQDEELGYADVSRCVKNYEIRTYEGYGVDDAKLTLNFHNFPEMASNNFIGTNGIVRNYTRLRSLSPYKYMFWERYWRELRGRTLQRMGPSMLYTCRFRLDDETSLSWYVGAESFDLVNDERKLLMYQY